MPWQEVHEALPFRKNFYGSSGRFYDVLQGTSEEGKNSIS
jgi:hypothetical protein